MEGQQEAGGTDLAERRVEGSGPAAEAGPPVAEQPPSGGLYGRSGGSGYGSRLSAPVPIPQIVEFIRYWSIGLTADAS